jgi:hypothetical protein
MAKMQVFDPAMCCSTGVCGPSVDPTLRAFLPPERKILFWQNAASVKLDSSTKCEINTPSALS